MTLKEFAEKLDGTMEYPSMSKDIVKAAAESGIVIVHGCSDDLIEFEGAIRDEAGCFDGGKVYFNKSGFIEEGSVAAGSIKVFWCGQCEDEKRPFEATWEYETDIPHETFRMLDEEELYCKGIVFYLKDIDRKDRIIELISRDSAIRAMDELEQEDINIYGCKIPEGFDGERARLAICLLPTVEVVKLTRENIEVMLSIAYRSGWKDGRDGKDLPALKELDEMVKAIYDRATGKPIGSLKETGEAAGAYSDAPTLYPGA